MLQFKDVKKTYRQGDQTVQALSGLSLSVEESGFFAVMGRSGSGKSTLLHLAAGLDRPDSGEVKIAGRDISKLSERELTRFRRLSVGMVFQSFNLIPTLTAAQNVALPGVIDGRSRSWLDKRVAQLLVQLEMSGRAHHRPEAMSGGEQQRIAIARAMLFNPPLILADEPTGNLDSTSSQLLWKLLRDLAEQSQITVLMVTHEAAAAVNCRRVYVLEDGKCTHNFKTEGLDASSLASRCQQPGR